jgi:hypothetical protein
MYLHVRVLFTIILGLGVSRLLTGVARIVQHPKEYNVYWVHLLWALFVRYAGSKGFENTDSTLCCSGCATWK